MYGKNTQTVEKAWIGLTKLFTPERRVLICIRMKKDREYDRYWLLCTQTEHLQVRMRWCLIDAKRETNSRSNEENEETATVKWISG